MIYEKNYSNELIEVIKNTKLTDDDDKVLSRCLNTIKNNNLLLIFEDMYKLYLNDYSMIELARIYNRSPRTIQMIFKKIGLNRDRFEAQKIAAKKRNYVEIRKTLKKTMCERFVENQLLGSKIEQYTRFQVNLLLNELLLESEIIIGINTMTKAGELDIPIIIFFNSKIFRFGIEVDGKIFHDNISRKKSDSNKDSDLNQLGYKIFRLNTKAYFHNKNNPMIKYENELKSKLLCICNEIKKEITLESE